MGSEQAGLSAARFTDKSGETSFLITFGRGNMEAYIQIWGDGRQLTLEEIVNALKASKIAKGVSRKVVDNILAGEHGKEPILFAKGKEPQDGEDGWFEFFFRTDMEKKPTELEDGSVDYLNVEWFEVVTQNQKIAEYHPAQDGVEGFDVLGNVIPARKGKELSLLKGKNFRISEDKRFYYSDMNGRIIYEDNYMEISRLFILDELSLATGNLEFDGSVQVKGNIGSSISLKATDDIVIDGFVESSDIEAGGSIMFRKGMNGAAEGGTGGTVIAGDYIAGKFFESVKINCQGSVQADYLLNCDIYAKETIRVSGKKGSIAGGNAYALLGFVTQDIGNRIGLSTNIKTGINDEVLREQLKLEDTLKETAKSIQKLKAARNEFEVQFTVEECFAMTKYNKIVEILESQEAVFEKLEKKSEETAAYMERLRSAEIVINNNLYDGVNFEINRQKYMPPALRNVTIKMVGNRVTVYENNIKKK